MRELLLSQLPCLIAGAALYLYVAVAAGRAESRAGSGLLLVVAKATAWPVTIWDTIEELYFTPLRRPRAGASQSCSWLSLMRSLSMEMVLCQECCETALASRDRLVVHRHGSPALE